MPHDIFISYSQPDRDCALELTEHLEAECLSVWIAPRDVSPAADWAAEIIEALSVARVMVLVFSANSNESPQVRREVERAVHKELLILPFRIEDVLPSKSLEYFLSAQHWLDAFPPPRQRYYGHLCAHLKSLLSVASGAATASSAMQPASPGRSAPAATGPAPPAARFDAAELRAVEAQLARHLGPVAQLLVRRVAARSPDFEHLMRALAAEVERDADRHRFVEACARLRHSRD